MKNRFTRGIAVVLVVGVLAFLTGEARAQAHTFRTDDAQPQVVHFFADHTLGEVEGTLQPVVGALTFDPGVPTDGLSGRFTADVTSFDTGLGMRDRDMRQNYLETERYPEAHFVLEDARPTLLDGSTPDTLRLAVAGAMTLHGVTRELVVRAVVTRTDVGVEVHAAFPILLTDYGIRPPRRFMLKVGDEVRLDVRLHLKQAQP